MITLEKSKQLLLRKIEKKFYQHINNIDQYPEQYLKVQKKTLQKVKKYYILIAALPSSNHIFEWFRTNIDKIHIELVDDKVKIYKIESQYLEQIEFGEGDLFNLIFKALENQN